MKKGQFLRLFVYNGQASGAVPVAAATNMQLHVSVATENASTKDDEGDWDVIEPVGISFDISSDALVIDNENPNSESNLAVLEDVLNDTPLEFSINETQGTKNREPVSNGELCSGNLKLTSLQVTAANRQNSTFTAQFNGYGKMIVQGASVSSPSNSPAPEVADPVTLDPEEGNDEG